MSTDEPEVQVRSQYKKQKHSRACEFCRRRKVGCDAVDRPDNRCSMCIAHGMECKYDPGTKVKRPSNKYVEVLETRLSKVEDLLKKLQSDAALTGDDAEHLEDALRPQRPPSVSKHPHPNWSSIKVIYPRGVHPATDSSEEIDRSDNEEGFAVTDVNFTGYTGKSSNLDLIRTVIDLKSEHNGASMDVEYEKPFAHLQTKFTPDMLAVGAMVSSVVPPFKGPDFPPPDIMAELVDLYFDHFNTYLPLLHRPTFESELKSGLHVRDRGFGTVVLLVCATGSAWAYGSLHAEPHQSPGWQLFNKVSMTEYSLLARPRLYDVQVCALMAAYMNTTNSLQGTLPILSLGIRMAQAVGAHRKKMYSATPTVEQELWKRAFWALVAMDRLASFGMGRQCITHDEDFDLDPMIECDDEYWSHPDPSQAFQQPPGKPSNVTFCNAFIRLLKIEAFASRTIFTINKSKLLLGYVGPEWKQRIVAELDSSMNKWLDTIPSHLRWDPNREDDVFLNQSAILYSNYYQLQIFIHRSFIPSPRRPLANANLSLPSMTICVSAARACLRVLEVQHRRTKATWSGFTLYALTPLQMPLFTVGIMLLVYLWGGVRDTNATLKDVSICLSILKELTEAGNLAARKLGLILRAMCPTAQRPPSERSYPPPGSNLAQEGPKTIDELVTAAMQHLTLSGYRLADGSDVRADPTNSEILSLLTAPKRVLSAPSPFVKASPSSSSSRGPAGMMPEQGANHNRLAFNAVAGHDVRAPQLNAFGSDFMSPRLPSDSATIHPGSTPGQTANGVSVSLPPQSALGAAVPMPSDPDPGASVAGPSELGFAFGNALMADDLHFFDSLSSMFGNAQNPNPPPPAAPSSSSFGPPQSTTPFPTTVGPLETWSLGQPELPPAAANSTPLGVQSEGNQDPRPWQWVLAQEGGLWDQWGTYFPNQGGAANTNQPPL